MRCGNSFIHNSFNLRCFSFISLNCVTEHQIFHFGSANNQKFVLVVAPRVARPGLGYHNTPSTSTNCTGSEFNCTISFRNEATTERLQWKSSELSWDTDHQRRWLYQISWHFYRIFHRINRRRNRRVCLCTRTDPRTIWPSSVSRSSRWVLQRCWAK